MDKRRQSGLWDQNAQTGEYERRAPAGPYQYYKPSTNTSENRRSYSERSADPVSDGQSDAYRAATKNGLERSTSVKKGPTYDSDPADISPVEQLDNDAADLSTSHKLGKPQMATTKHIDEVDSESNEHDNEHHGISYHDDDDDEIPENLRKKAWSPEPDSPVLPEKDLPQRHASNASQHIRRGSVPDRSPLQHLEAKLGDMGKEEKRARMEEAERKMTRKDSDTIGGASNENRRSVSDGGRRSEDRQQRRSVSDEVPRKSQSHRRAESGSEKFHRATDALRSGLADDNSGEPDSYDALPTRPTANTSREVKANRVSRSDSKRDHHSGRASGAMPVAAAIGTAAFANDAAARGKAAHERRKREAAASKTASRSAQPIEAKQPTDRVLDSGPHETKQTTVKPVTTDHRDASWGPSTGIPASPTSTRTSGEIQRSRSKKLQKQPPPGVYQPSSASNPLRSVSRRSIDTVQPLTDRSDANQSKIKSSLEPLEPDIVPRDAVKTGHDTEVPYSIPPQTAGAKQAKERVSFAPDVINQPERDEAQEHRFSDMFGDHHVQARGYQSKAAALDEWKNAKILKLAASDLLFDDGHDSNRDSAWWESNGRRPAPASTARVIPYEEQATSFDPPLFLKCGPLLRFTGLRKEQSVATTWRGSIMILTEDASSDLRQAPILRLFAQDMDLYKAPAHPQHANNDQHDQQHDHEDEDDAITGQMKISRIGRPIYVRSVQEIQHGVDLSRQENKTGLFSAIAPQVHSNGDQAQPHTSQSRINGQDGEASDKYQEVQAHRLHVEHGCTFWRFNIEVELGSHQRRIAYRINNGPAVGFWVPSKHESMNIMFHSCNGFSLSVDPDEFCGPDPLWRDVLNRHQKHPFHVMIGGGDQIYNDAVIRDTTHFKEWLQIKNPEHKYHADFTIQMQEELETFYFERYSMWFSQGLFGMANAQIPMVNIYDDHDQIDGYGSYPHHFMSSPVFTGLGAIAFKYYMLFQHQALPTETAKDEPSWLLGASPGPYVNELNRSVFMWMGEKVAFLGIDCRTERMRDEILSLESYDLIFERCRAEIVKGETKHLIVLLGVPIAYPRLNFLENILTSRAMDPIKAIGRTGALGGFVNKFDGGVEILDDLDDHWTAKHHKRERNWFIQELQELAAEKSVRVTILGGDVHLGAVGQFFSNKKLGLAKDKDHRYMPNIISSAIVNTPPPPMMADVLNRRNKIHHLDHETDEDMIPMFEHDVDGSRRNNKRLLARRNFAIIKEYMPGTTPPPSPIPEHNLPTTDSSQDVNDRAYPPGSMSRGKSLGHGSGSLIRRLSLRSRNQAPTFIPVQPKRPFSFHEQAESDDFNAMQRSSSLSAASDSQRPTNTFQRRPTNLSLKEARRAAAKGGAEDEDGSMAGHINLEHGLDITLCMEVDQHDAGGRTVPYRLLVPALWYNGPGDKNTLSLPARRPSLFQRMTSGRLQRQLLPEASADYDQDASEDESMVGIPADHHNSATTNRGKELADMQAVAAGAGRGADYGSSGAFGQPRSSFQTGYDLKAPPIGNLSHQSDGAHDLNKAQNSAPDHVQEQDSDSLTASQDNPSYQGEDEDISPQEAWRYSKAERFFGIGDEGGPANNSATLGKSSSDTGKKRSSWMPWKRGGSLRNWPGTAQ